MFSFKYVKCDKQYFKMYCIVSTKNYVKKIISNTNKFLNNECLIK